MRLHHTLVKASNITRRAAAPKDLEPRPSPTLEKGMAAHSSALPGESHGQRSLAGYSPRGRREPDMSERLSVRYEPFQETRVLHGGCMTVS